MRLNQSHPLPVSPNGGAVHDFDLQMIETRCRLKAVGSRWAAARQRLMASGADFYSDVAPLDKEIIDRAKSLPNCFLWMNYPGCLASENLNQVDQLGDCFETLADALALVNTAAGDKGIHQEAVCLLAEAQSALRIAVEQVNGPLDNDQLAAFDWLRHITRETQMFIERHMRSDDPADPANNDDLVARIKTLRIRLHVSEDRSNRQRTLLNTLRHAAMCIRSRPENAAPHWDMIRRSIDDLIADGVPPSNRDIREALLPIVDDFPLDERLPPNVERVIAEIDRYFATAVMPEVAVPVTDPTKEVRQVAQALEGKALVLIGGYRRPHAHQAITDAFGLSDLIWVETTPHESVANFETHIARNDVAAVLLAIRWASHGFGEVQRFCDKHGKPLVRLPGGYNPNQLAAQIAQQCSNRLEANSVTP